MRNEDEPGEADGGEYRGRGARAQASKAAIGVREHEREDATDGAPIDKDAGQKAGRALNRRVGWTGSGLYYLGDTPARVRKGASVRTSRLLPSPGP